MTAEETLQGPASGLHVLITRPLHQARRTAKALDRDGHTCRIEPLLTVHSLATEPPGDPISAIAITSVNAISALDRHPGVQGLPVYCTGERTGQALKQAGFEDIRMARGGAAALASLVAAVPPPLDGPVLYPCARVTAQNMSTLLAQYGVACQPWFVYDVVEAEAFSADVRQALVANRFHAVLLYSARTASTFVRLFADLPTDTNWPTLVALSPEICATLPAHARLHCRGAKEPDEAAIRSILTQMMQ